jgi:acylglycerol lipase
VRHFEDTFEGRRGRSIYWQSWVPEHGERVRGKLIVCHGASEHGGRYRYLVERLVPAGWAVDVHDQRGHGRSEGKRAQIDRLDDALADLDTFVDLVTAEAPAGEPILLGHSMGGCLAIAYALRKRHQAKLHALALSSPLASLAAAPLAMRIAARVLSVVAPNAGIFPVDAEGISRDPDEVEAYVSDPLNYHGKLPIRTVAELAKAIDTFEADAPQIELPLLVMVGSADPIVPPEGGRMIYERASSADKTLKVYDGFFHELINEPKPDRDRVLDDLAAWLGIHTTGATSAPAAAAVSASG